MSIRGGLLLAQALAAAVAMMMGAPAASAGETAHGQRVGSPRFQRTGWVVLGVAGVGDCVGTVCKKGEWAEYPRFDTVGNLFADADPGPGPMAGFEFGYRPVPYVDVVAGFSVLYQPIEGQPGSTLFSIGYGLVAGANVYPVAFGRLDPYVGAGLGFFQLWAHQDLVNATVHMDRGLFRASAGLDVYVTPRFTIGPRLDFDVPFAGRLCAEFSLSDDYADGCDSIADLGEFGEGMPKLWRVGVAFKGRLGRRG